MTDEVLVKDKQVVVPGETLATGMGVLPSRGSYRDGDRVVASKLGLAHVDGNVIKIVPLSGRYDPRVNDRVIAKVTDVLMTGWRLDIDSAYSAILGLKEATSEFIERGADLTRIYKIGDYVVAKITQVTSQKLIDVSMRGPGFRKLRGGRIIKINSSKVPRVIGKEGSMVKLIKDATGCNITVGQNGLIWVSGEPEQEIKAIETIKKVEAESHIPGLTDRIQAYLKGESQ